MKQPRSAATPGRTGIPRTSEFRLQIFAYVNTATTAPALMLNMWQPNTVCPILQFNSFGDGTPRPTCCTPKPLANSSQPSQGTC